MRIGIMCLASCGGSACIATQLATELSHRNHIVHLFTRTMPFNDELNGNGNLKLHTIAPAREANLHPANLHVHWSSEDYQHFLAQVLDCIVTDGLDILHFHYGVPFAFVAAEVKQHLGWAAPLLVGTLHGTDVSNFGQDSTIAPRLTQALGQLDGLTTVSRNHAQLATLLLNLPAPPQIIPNFINLSKFQPAPVSRSNGKTRIVKPRIAHVSNFRPVKDTPAVARIFVDIRQQMEAELWLIGDGPELDRVKSILGDSGFERDVRYWGLQHEVGPILAQTDLLLMTSWAESFCLAALEAMACGVPVLATRVGGLPEVVVEGETGYLFPVGGHKLAVRLAIDLFSKPGQHWAMRKAAVKRAARFSANRIVPRYEALYQNIIQHHMLAAMVAAQR